jgi:hypothetical protein
MMSIEELRKHIYNLWGTTIYDFKFDLLLQNICINIIDVSEKGNSYYELRFINVNKILFDKSHTQTGWNYVELTEIEITLIDDVYSIEIILWSDDKILTIESQKVEILCVLNEQLS